MQRILLPLSLTAILLLTACNGGDPLASCDGTPSVVDTFSLCIPPGYIMATQEFGDATNYIIHLGKTDGREQLMQIHVKKDRLLDPVNSSMEFAERAVELSRQNAPNYMPVSTEPIEVNGQQTLLHVFEAQPDPEQEAVRYHQFVVTHTGTAYGFTAVLNPSATDEEAETMLAALQGVAFND